MIDYVFQEYPKAMYRRGEYLEVSDKREEKAALKDGFLDYYGDQRRQGAPKDDPVKTVPAEVLSDVYSQPAEAQQ